MGPNPIDNKFPTDCNDASSKIATAYMYMYFLNCFMLACACACNSKRGGGDFCCLCLRLVIHVSVYSLSVCYNICLSSCRLTLRTHTDDNDLSFQHFASDFIINGEVSLSYMYVHVHVHVHSLNCTCSCSIL